VAHNRRSTKYFKVDLEKRAPNYMEVKEYVSYSAKTGETYIGFQDT